MSDSPLSAGQLAELVALMVKHLPPSGARLHLWDVGGRVGALLPAHRADLRVQAVPDDPAQWPDTENTIDGIMGLGVPGTLAPAFLAAALRVMRPGGRMVLLEPQTDPTREIVTVLEDAGHTRILVEPAPVGLLVRGEKPHTTASTFARVRVAADADADDLDWAAYAEPYAYLLVAQSPNKPVWALKPDETLTWQAVTVMLDGAQTLLAFTSLPKAVSFMQPAVMQGFVRDVNKVGKFKREVLAGWGVPVRLNPTLDGLRGVDVVMWAVDPAAAEAPDE